MIGIIKVEILVFKWFCFLLRDFWIKKGEEGLLYFKMNCVVFKVFKVLRKNLVFMFKWKVFLIFKFFLILIEVLVVLLCLEFKDLNKVLFFFKVSLMVEFKELYNLMFFLNFFLFKVKEEMYFLGRIFW